MRTYVVTEYEREDWDAAENMPDEEVLELLQQIDRGWLPDYNYRYSKKEEDFSHYKLHVAMDIPLGFAIKNGRPLKEWLSSFNTDSAPICFNKIQDLKRECEKE